MGVEINHRNELRNELQMSYERVTDKPVGWWNEPPEANGQ